MTTTASPIRLADGRVYISGIGFLTLPKGLALTVYPKKGRPHVTAYSVDGTRRCQFYVDYHTKKDWMAAIYSAISWLKTVRKHLLTRRALKEAVPGGPVPGFGQPGVYGNEVYPAPRALDPNSNTIIYTGTLAVAENVRKAAESRYLQDAAFSLHNMISA